MVEKARRGIRTDIFEVTLKGALDLTHKRSLLLVDIQNHRRTEVEALGPREASRSVACRYQRTKKSIYRQIATDKRLREK
jgi:hypothetical protein